MSGGPKTKKPAAKVAAKPESKKRESGAWVVVGHDDAVLSVEQSEVRALRIAVEHGAKVVRWKFGALRPEVLGGAS